MSADGARAEGWEAPPGTVGCGAQTPRVWPWVCWHEVPKGPRLPIGTCGHAHPSARNPHSLWACSLRIPRFCPGCLSWQVLGGSRGSAFPMCPQVVAGTMAGETTGLHYCIDYALPWSKQSSFFLAGGQRAELISGGGHDYLCTIEHFLCSCKLCCDFCHAAPLKV